MKKLFSMILVICSLLGGNTYADTKIIDTFKKRYENEVLFSVYTLCIDGYKFITTQDISSAGGYNTRSTSTSVNTIQFMIAENGKMIPAKCR